MARSAAAASSASVLRDLGYREPSVVEGRSSVADLFPASRRCGVYVLEFANGEVYGGQAVDVTRRYVQHLRTHTDLVRLFFKRVPRPALNDFERQVIETLQQRGLKTRNITFSSTIAGETDLDVVMPFALQKRFEDVLSFNDSGGRRTNDADVRRKLSGRFERFIRRRQADDVVALLRSYVPRCIPAFIRTELSFWELSLPPRPPWVYARVNVGWQEVLTAFEEDDGSLWFSFHVAASPLGLYGKGAAARGRVAKTMGVDAYNPFYKPGGPDQVRLVAQSDAARDVLRDRRFLGAARLLNLRLMRKSATPYGKFHCFALADAILPREVGTTKARA